MIFIYLIFNIIVVYFSFVRIYKTLINPISIYCAVWSFALTIYESGLIDYYPLSSITWVVIILFQIIYIISCILGTKDIKNNTPIRIERINVLKEKKVLKNIIIIITVFAALAIVTNTLIYMRIYGVNLLAKTNEIYSDRVHNLRQIRTIPYIGTFNYIAIILSGVYIKRHGFKLFTLFPVLLVILDILITGGRAGIVFAFLMFLAPLLPRAKSLDSQKNNKQKISFLKKMLLIIPVIGMLGIVVVISQNRAAGGEIPYATERYKLLLGNNVTIFKILAYSSAQIGVLNIVLKELPFNFGHHTFLTIYNILNKFGLNIPIEQYQTNYYTPVDSNVGTYIRELIEDFTILGAVIPTIILGYVFSRTWINPSKSYAADIVCGALFCIVTFSFFDWKFRSATFWIIIFFGSIIGIWIDNTLKVGVKRYEKRSHSSEL